MLPGRSSEREPTPSTRVPSPGRLSKPAKIGLGLVLTLVGLFLVAILFPTSPSDVSTLLPVAAVGILAVWVGGILLGQGSRS